MLKKRAIAIVEKGTNYFFHVQAVSKINYDSNYAEFYKASIFEEDLNYLKENKNLFLFGNGNPFSILTDTYLFTPAQLNLDSEDKLTEYFELLGFCIREGDIKALYERYNEDYEKVEMLLGKGYRDRLRGNIISIKSECADRAFKIADILKRNFNSFEKLVWNNERVKLEACANHLNNRLAGPDIIKRLETFVGLEYKTELFRVALCSANGNGPDCNDLGYDKNLHFYDIDIAYLVRLIQHEICIRIISPLRKFYSEYDSFTVFDAFESLAKFYNYQVFGGDLPYFEDFKIFYIYGEIWTSKGNLKPEELLSLAFVEYNRLS
jgi:hypothetical protein